MNSFTISIVIPTYNRPNLLLKTLDALEGQQTEMQYEVIIIDDCSPCRLPDLQLGQEKRKSWQLLRNNENLGRAASRNRGINEARGKYILLLDDDIFAAPQLVQKHYEKQKEIGGGVVVGSIPPAKEVPDTVWNRYLDLRFKRMHQRLAVKEIDYGLFITGNVSIVAEKLKKAGGLDESFKDYSFEDTELGYRLHSAGVRFAHEPQAIGHHCYDEDLDSLLKKDYEAGMSSRIFIKLHPEAARDIQYHSLVKEPWSLASAPKNIMKVILYSAVVQFILYHVTQVAARLNWDAAVFGSLPWLELGSRARGARVALRED